ncbi:hypothetical protein [Bosea sp. (in: a-proteobacteria)]|uniref:hypothetical protein n=1 Tax=Bosea sp. (in: a-proteobacteria) TaxID=1871050 RepID=UPI003B3B066A
MRLSLFGKAAAGGGDGKAVARAQAERIKSAVRRLLALPEQASVAVNEIICADPACPGSETVILVMRPGARTQACKLQLAMTEVTDAALAEALAGLSNGP